MSENKHTPGQITALSDQFVCHPASRSINEIEMAGEIMRDLLKQRDELLAALKKLTDVFANIGITSGLYDDEQDALESACAAIASVKELK